MRELILKKTNMNMLMENKSLSDSFCKIVELRMKNEKVF